MVTVIYTIKLEAMHKKIHWLNRKPPAEAGGCCFSLPQGNQEGDNRRAGRDGLAIAAGSCCIWKNLQARSRST